MWPRQSAAARSGCVAAPEVSTNADRKETHDEDGGLRTAPLLQLLRYARRDGAERRVIQALAGVVDPDHLQLLLGCVRVHLRRIVRHCWQRGRNRVHCSFCKAISWYDLQWDPLVLLLLSGCTMHASAEAGFAWTRHILSIDDSIQRAEDGAAFMQQQGAGERGTHTWTRAVSSGIAKVR